jgi:hypothetical protein
VNLLVSKGKIFLRSESKERINWILGANVNRTTEEAQETACK